jgi:hypothetical protein
MPPLLPSPAPFMFMKLGKPSNPLNPLLSIRDSMSDPGN